MSGIERIAEAFARARADGRRAALMPYMMGCFPDRERSEAIACAYVDAGADLIEFGIPFSDPLADGPVIHEAGDGRAARRSHRPDALAVAATVAESRPGGAHVLREPDPRPRARALRRRSSRGWAWRA